MSRGYYSVSFWVNFKVVKSLLSTFTRTRIATVALHKEDIKRISSGSTNYNTSLNGFFSHSIKTLKQVAQLFQVSIHIHPSLFIPTNRRQETVSILNMVLNNKTGALFLEFNRCKGTLF